MSDANKGTSSASKRKTALFNSLAVKIPLTFVIIMLLFVATFLLVMELRGKPILLEQSNQGVIQTGEAMVAQLRQRIKLTESFVKTLASAGESLPKEDALSLSVIQNMIDQENTESFIAGGGIWPEPYQYHPDIERRSFFWGRDPNGKLTFYEDYNHPESNGYHNEEWYVPAKLLKPGEVYWSRSYMDPYSYQSMVTATAPMFRDDKFYGVATIDLKLEGLTEFLSKRSEKFGGYAFALDRNGRFLSHPDQALIIKQGIDDAGNRSESYRNISELTQTIPSYGAIVDQLNQQEREHPLEDHRIQLAKKLADDSYQIDYEEALRITNAIESARLSAAEHKHVSTLEAELNTDTDPILNGPVLIDIFHVNDTHWRLVTVTPKTLAFATANNIIDSVLIASFLVLFISLLVGFLIIQEILVKPLINVTTQIKHVDLEKLATTKAPAITQIPSGELGELAIQFNEHTHQLIFAKIELEHQITLAKQATMAKSQFLANMSHEIRTPINGVLGMLTLLNHTQLTKQQQHYTSMAHSSAESLLTVINDILDFSKIEAGKLDIESFDFDLRSLLDDLACNMAHLAQRKGLELVLNINKIPHQMVQGDPGRIRQVLTNLISNAIKFTEEGEVVIKAKLENVGKMGLILYGTVKDTGIGIPKDKQQSLFKSFSQLDDTNTRKYGGTGLGLAISKQLCELMGGGISLISDGTQGSQFNFSINLQPSDHELPDLPSVNMQDIRVLIIDDNSTNRMVLREQLESWGAAVEEAANGHQALQCLHEHPSDYFQVAITDMRMPYMNGADLGKQIKSDTHYQHIHLIMMTSVGERGDANYFADLGFSGYFTKPASLQDVHDALSVVLDGGKALETATPLITHHHIQSLKRTNEHNDAKILLVEDNLINRQVALGLIERFGLHADTASNGQEALHYLKTAPESMPYELILMDCQMPVMDGFEATKAIRAGKCHDYHKGVVIIALTANAMKGDMEQCLREGMDDYMSKPIDPAILEEKLKLWLHKKAPA